MELLELLKIISDSKENATIETNRKTLEELIKIVNNNATILQEFRWIWFTSFVILLATMIFLLYRIEKLNKKFKKIKKSQKNC